MSDSSDGVKRWRRRTKSRMITAFGGKCGICGYDKCLAALEFHHLDEQKKEFQISTFSYYSFSWEKIVPELRKCVMLCANCHREVHDGIVELPEDITRFDEKFADYKAREAEARLNECPVCKRKKPKSQKYCSQECVYESRKTVSDEALLELKGKGYSKNKIAEELGISWHAVRKRLKKLEDSPEANLV